MFPKVHAAWCVENGLWGSKGMLGGGPGGDKGVWGWCGGNGSGEKWWFLGTCYSQS